MFLYLFLFSCFKQIWVVILWWMLQVVTRIFVENIVRFRVSQHVAQDHRARVIAQQFAHVLWVVVLWWVLKFDVVTWIFVNNIARFWVCQDFAQGLMTSVCAQKFAHVCKHNLNDMLTCRLNIARQKAPYVCTKFSHMICRNYWAGNGRCNRQSDFRQGNSNRLMFCYNSGQINYLSIYEAGWIKYIVALCLEIALNWL